MRFIDWLCCVQVNSGRVNRERKARNGTTHQPSLICLLEPRQLLAGVSANNDMNMALHDRVLTVDAASGVLENDSGWTDSGDGSNTYTLVASVASAPTHGSVTLSNDGSYVYTPTAGYVGSDSFTYTATYGPASQTATVSLSVVNYAPTLDGAEIMIADTTPNGTTIWTADANSNDGDTLSYSLSDPSGIFQINSTTGAVSVVNTEDIEGDAADPYTLTVSVTDGLTATTAEVKVAAKGDWKIINPTDSAVLPQANPVKVAVRHANRYSYGFKVDVTKMGGATVTRTRGVVRAGNNTEFDFGVLTPGTYTVKYTKFLSNGNPEEVESITVTVE